MQQRREEDADEADRFPWPHAELLQVEPPAEQRDEPEQGDEAETSLTTSRECSRAWGESTYAGSSV